MKEDKYSWEDVTISQFQEIMSIAEMKIPALDKLLNFLSVMTGEDVEYYLNLPYEEALKEIKKVSFISETKLEPRIPDGGSYKIDGVKYKLVPGARHMTAGQFIDYENTIGNNPNDTAMLCAIFCVPAGKKYGEDYDPLELKDIFFNKFKIVDAVGISFFFQKILDVSYDYTLRFLCRKLKKEGKKMNSPEKKKKIEEVITQLRSAMSGNG